MFSTLFQKLNKRFLLIPLLTIPFIACGQNLIGLYSDIGVWLDGKIALENFLSWAGFDFETIKNTDLNNKELKNYKLLIFPGGNAATYYYTLNDSNKNIIRDFIAKGGSYLGICAGAYFASRQTIWNDTSYFYGLNLFNGKAIGPINSIASWPNYNLAIINFNSSDSINTFLSKQKQILYYGGPYFEPDSTRIDTVAVFNTNYKPAIIKFNYAAGRVLLISVHPEIEENSGRDGTDFAANLTDPETDWDLLYYSILWLLNDSIIEIHANLADENQIIVFPNPVKHTLHITGIQPNTIEVFDLNGRKITYFQNTQTINLSALPSGIYILRINNKRQTILRKIVKI